MYTYRAAIYICIYTRIESLIVSLARLPARALDAVYILWLIYIVRDSLRAESEKQSADREVQIAKCRSTNYMRLSFSVSLSLALLLIQ